MKPKLSLDYVLQRQGFGCQGMIMAISPVTCCLQEIHYKQLYKNKTFKHSMAYLTIFNRYCNTTLCGRGRSIFEHKEKAKTQE